MTAHVHGQNTAEFGSGVAVDVKGRRRVKGLAMGPFPWDCSPMSFCLPERKAVPWTQGQPSSSSHVSLAVAPSSSNRPPAGLVPGTCCLPGAHCLGEPTGHTALLAHLHAGQAEGPFHGTGSSGQCGGL